MSKYGAVITDTHMGVRNDLLPIQKAQERFFTDVFWPTIDQHGIREILHLGDLVDNRTLIRFTTLDFMERVLLQPAQDRGCTITWILGNHDVFFKNTNRINASLAVKRFIENGTVELIDEVREHLFNGHGMLMVPWITQDNFEQTMDAVKDTNLSYCVGHLELIGFDFYRGIPSHTGFNPEDFEKFSQVWSGHYHHPSHRWDIRYLGAPYEMIWSDWGGPRGFHLFDGDTGQLEPVVNPDVVFHRFLYDDRQPMDTLQQELELIAQKDLKDRYVKVVIKHKDNPYWFDRYMETLNGTGAFDVDAVDDETFEPVVDEEGGGLAPPAMLNTEMIIRNYLDTLQLKQEVKQDVQTLLHELYVTAQDINVVQSTL
jgi:DNA repair exonuclease SbcCD nuclease subunit